MRVVATGKALVGREVLADFGVHGKWHGVVTKYFPVTADGEPLYHIRYDDGDSEDRVLSGRGDGTGATSGTSSDGNGPHSLVKCSVKLKPSGTILQRVPLDCVVPARIAPVLAVSRTDIVEVTAHELLDRDRRAKGYIGQAGVVVKVVDSGDATGMLLVTMGDGCVLRLAPAMVKRMQPTA